MAEHVEPYRAISPLPPLPSPEENIPTSVPPAQIDDSVPT